MNCQLYTGIVVEALGRRILDVPRSRELWQDEEHTAFVPTGEPLATGDIAFLTDNPDKDPRFFHVGVILVAEDGINWLTHNATHHGTAVIERLEDAVAHPSYGTIAGIKRPVVENPNGTDHAFLEAHGLSDLIQTA